MKKIKILLLTMIASLGLSSCGYNTMVEMDEAVSAQWQQVENVYQSRMDKTKNLMEIVKGAASTEKEILESVMEARSKATSIQINANDLTPENLAKFEKAQAQFSGSLGRLMAVAEKYPELQSISAFRDFQAQYEGMENRIAVERKKFNETAQAYNTYIRKFPNNFIASSFGFKARPYFEAAEGAEVAPEIKF
jgi:LemA protein